jgi:hypothetical protein
VTYGIGTTLSDGNAYFITIDGRTIVVGNPCGAAPSCLPIPAGVAALVEVLRQVAVQEGDGDAGDCRANGWQ